MNSRSEYLNAVKNQLEQNIFYHSLALEACMGGLFDYCVNLPKSCHCERSEAIPLESRNDWTLAGLLHDIDYSDSFKNDHPNKTTEVLAKYNLEVSDEILNIIRAHAPKSSDVEPKSLAQWSIFCADSLTGLIVATALVYPSKKLADVKTSSIVKRFLKEPRFAAGTRRDEVAMCSNPEGLNIPLEKFIEICLVSMQGVAHEIAL